MTAPSLTNLARRLAADTHAASATEFALALPLLMVMMWTFLEAGRYIDHVHVASKAVRDGVRYATRQPFAAFGCAAGGGFDAAVDTAIKRYVRTGSATGTTGRLSYWTSDGTVTVSAECNRSITGIYEDLVGGAPVVQISANIPYTPILPGLSSLTGLYVRATAQGAVMGI